MGTALGVSPGRARQLRNSALAAIQRESQWPQELARRLDELLLQRDEPLFLDRISAKDPWLVGFDDNPALLGRLIEALTDNAVHVWPLDGRLVASESARPESPKRPVAKGRGVGRTIAAILDASDRPLHIDEIRERLTTQALARHRDYASRNGFRLAIRSAGALLFARSVYGLAKHIPLSAAAAHDLQVEIEAIMVSGPAGRQWHCSEILAELRARHLVLSEDIDQYIVNILLDRSGTATYLGRFVWVAGEAPEHIPGRLEIAALCEVALVRAGRPLTRAELRAEVQKLRGLNHNFLPQPSARVVRVARGQWGLVDRDT